jgi:hypothetical protein
MKYSQTLIDELQKDIRAYCAECMGGSRSQAAECKSVVCRLYKWRRLPEQQDLFQPLKTDFFNQGIVFAREFFSAEPRYWDDFITTFCNRWGKPVHPKWTGQLAIRLRRSGLRRLDQSRTSRIKEAKRRRVNLWTTVA